MMMKMMIAGLVYWKSNSVWRVIVCGSKSNTVYLLFLSDFVGGQEAAVEIDRHMKDRIFYFTNIGSTTTSSIGTNSTNTSST